MPAQAGEGEGKATKKEILFTDLYFYVERSLPSPACANAQPTSPTGGEVKARYF